MKLWIRMDWPDPCEPSQTLSLWFDGSDFWASFGSCQSSRLRMLPSGMDKGEADSWLFFFEAHVASDPHVAAGTAFSVEQLPEV